jgi:hypothetical protein
MLVGGEAPPPRVFQRSQYMTTDLLKKQYGEKWGDGMGWQNVDDETSMKYFRFPELEIENSEQLLAISNTVFSSFDEMQRSNLVKPFTP